MKSRPDRGAALSADPVQADAPWAVAPTQSSTDPIGISACTAAPSGIAASRSTVLCEFGTCTREFGTVSVSRHSVVVHNGPWVKPRGREIGLRASGHALEQQDGRVGALAPYHPGRAVRGGEVRERPHARDREIWPRAAAAAAAPAAAAAIKVTALLLHERGASSGDSELRVAGQRGE